MLARISDEGLGRFVRQSLDSESAADDDTVAGDRIAVMAEQEHDGVRRSRGANHGAAGRRLGMPQSPPRSRFLFNTI